MRHVNWEYYSSLFEKVSEAEFEKSELLAEKEVKVVIGPIRWATITTDTFGYEQLQDCICKVMDKMAENAEFEKRRGISSVSNDGYSESYTVRTEEELQKELHSLIRTWLSGSGLVGAY